MISYRIVGFVRRSQDARAPQRLLNRKDGAFPIYRQMTTIGRRRLDLEDQHLPVRPARTTGPAYLADPCTMIRPGLCLELPAAFTFGGFLDSLAEAAQASLYIHQPSSIDPELPPPNLVGRLQTVKPARTPATIDPRLQVDLTTTAGHIPCAGMAIGVQHPLVTQLLHSIYGVATDDVSPYVRYSLSLPHAAHAEPIYLERQADPIARDAVHPATPKRLLPRPEDPSTPRGPW